MKPGFFVLVFSLFLTGCSYSDPLEIPGLDGAAFKADRAGCNGARERQIELLKENKDRFLGISENEIAKAIGRYDYQVLDRKNEKIFVYYLEPGPQCEQIQEPTNAESLVLYLNAVKLVKEVMIRKGGHVVEQSNL
ncbi:hypothetical protein [Leadbetterella sp. DM7]|uniref:hypothetical protein n=1 Tax=Leadbetterella sp. DM7 TaxID=3235085 RepID=UPI00349E65BA